jgi:hypothetical protein
MKDETEEIAVRLDGAFRPPGAVAREVLSVGIEEGGIGFEIEMTEPKLLLSPDQFDALIKGLQQAKEHAREMRRKAARL